MNRLQRVNVVIGALALMLLVASVIERSWLGALAMILVLLGQAISFLDERKRSGSQPSRG